MKKVLGIFILITFLVIFSCNNDDPEIQLSPKSVTDCSFLCDSNDNCTDICIGGPKVVSINENITYASKTTLDGANLQWTTNTEGIEILNIENSIDNGIVKSIATLKFNSNFNGGSISVITTNDNVESTTNYPIELQN